MNNNVHTNSFRSNLCLNYFSWKVFDSDRLDAKVPLMNLIAVLLLPQCI